MTRRAKIEDLAAELRLPSTLPSEPLPSDALPFNDVVEQRFRELFKLCTDPKDLTAALKVAVDWAKVKAEQDGLKGWGDALRGGTGR